MKKEKRFIFMDFGDTIMYTEPTYFQRIALSMQALGFEVSYDEVEKSFIRSDHQIFTIYKEENLNGLQLPERMVEIFFQCLGLKIKGSIRETMDAMGEKLLHLPHKRLLFPETREVLEELRLRGYGLGIISNNDGFTREKCQDLGIESYFQVIVDSTREKASKPDRRLFEIAMTRAEVEPEEAFHVGDLYGSDVLGGMNAGLTPIWINQRSVKATAQKPPYEIKSLRELLDLLPKSEAFLKG